MAHERFIHQTSIDFIHNGDLWGIEQVNLRVYISMWLLSYNVASNTTMIEVQLNIILLVWLYEAPRSLKGARNPWCLSTLLVLLWSQTQVAKLYSGTEAFFVQRNTIGELDSPLVRRLMVVTRPVISADYITQVFLWVSLQILDTTVLLVSYSLSLEHRPAYTSPRNDVWQEHHLGP